MQCLLASLLFHPLLSYGYTHTIDEDADDVQELEAMEAMEEDLRQAESKMLELQLQVGIRQASRAG